MVDPAADDEADDVADTAGLTEADVADVDEAVKLTEDVVVSDGVALIEAVDVLDDEREIVEVVDADTP